MKRNVICGQCLDGWQRLVGKYPGEEVTIVKGTALANYLCDDCGKTIAAKSFAAAVSVSTVTTPYSAWEHDYVKPFPTQFQSAQPPLPREP